MRFSRFVVGLALLCAVPLSFAQPAKSPNADDPKIAFERYTLPNGLEVILAPDKSVPLVAASVWYHVGSGYEVHGKSGFAHLFEHMVFQGSKHVGNDQHFAILKKIGAATVNGTTNPDRTNYFEVVPSNQLETALWLESDRMGYLLDKLTLESLKNQIDVVRNERRQRYDNVPYGKARFAIYAALFPEGHPYRYLTIGKHEDLEAASLDDVKNFFKTWYVPANATLALAGDFDVPAAKKLVEKWFGAFPKSTKPKVVAVPAPVAKATEIAVDDPFAKQRQISFAWLSPANFGDGDAELDIAAFALRREGPGRLYKALIYDRPLATSVSAFQFGSQFSGIFQITVTLRPEANVDEVKQIVAAEVARLTREPLPAKEIARVVAANEAGAIRRLESVLGRSETLQAYNHYLGDPDKISWDLDRYRKATPEAIRAMAAKYLVPERMVTVITNPTGGAK
jgi:predicted Zn-dependent peptidase